MAIKKQTSKTNKPAPKQAAPKKTVSRGAKSSGRQTLASLWDEKDASAATTLPPPGEHEMRLNKLEQKDDPKKGTAVFVEYEGLEGEAEGKKIRQMYKLTDEGGNKAPGMAYLVRDLELLGYE